MTTVIFSHGQESGPWGTKIGAMAEQVRSMGCEADSIDYQGIADPTERVQKLIGACREIDDTLILVGSSNGAAMWATAGAASLNAAGVFVLAPAYDMPGYEELTPTAPDMPICIVHGWSDDIVPVENSIRFAQSCSAELHILDGDHRLTDNIDDINYYLRRFVEKIMGTP